MVQLKKQANSRSRPATAVLGAIILGTFVCGCAPSTKTGVGKPLDAPRVAPDFALEDSEGSTVRLTDYRGKVVALNFWATWCGPCRAEIPWLNLLETQHASQGFAVIGISVDEQGWRTVKPFMSKLGVRYRVLLGDRRMSTLYAGADVLPTTILLDRQGRFAAIHAGVVNRSKFEDTLARLLRADSGTLAEQVPSGN